MSDSRPGPVLLSGGGMRFATKLLLWLAAPIVLLLAGYGYLDERRTRQRFLEELGGEGRAITRTVQHSMHEALRDGEPEDIPKLVDRITGFERVYGLRIFNENGEMIYQSAPLVGQPFLARDELAHVLATREPAQTRRLLEGTEPLLTYIMPLQNPDSSLYGAVQMLQLESFVDREIRAARNSIILLTLSLIIVTGGTVLLVTRYVVGRPVEGFVQSIRGIRPGDPGARLPLLGSAELRKLAQEFNALWERLEDARRELLTEQEERRRAEDRFKNAERLAALGQLAAGLAHEIGTPLHVIGGRTDVLRRQKSSDELFSKNLNIISEQLDRITRIVRDMLEFARVRELHLAPVHPVEVLDAVLEFVDHRLETSGIRVDRVYPGDVPVIQADPDQIYEVFLNLILNAADAMNQGGALRISVGSVRSAHPEGNGNASDYLSVRFQDSGEGISPEHLKRVFEPFFTTKAIGKGTGLGMSVSYGIVREHGGWVDISSERGVGTTVSVYLPVTVAADVALRGTGS